MIFLTSAKLFSLTAPQPEQEQSYHNNVPETQVTDNVTIYTIGKEQVGLRISDSECIDIKFNFYTIPANYPSIIGNSVDFIKVFNSFGEIVYEEDNLSILSEKNIYIKKIPAGFYLIESAKSSDNLRWLQNLSIAK